MKHSLTSALIVALGLIGVASAADTVTVKLLESGFEQQIEIPLDEIAVGSSRQLATASGLPAIVTRKEDGLTIEVAGRTTEIDLPDPAAFAHHAGDGKRQVMLRKHHEHAAGEGNDDKREQHEKRIVIKHAGEGEAMSEAEIEALLADSDVPGDGKRVVVIRKIHRDEAPVQVD